MCPVPLHTLSQMHARARKSKFLRAEKSSNSYINVGTQLFNLHPWPCHQAIRCLLANSLFSLCIFIQKLEAVIIYSGLIIQNTHNSSQFNCFIRCVKRRKDFIRSMTLLYCCLVDTIVISFDFCIHNINIQNYVCFFYNFVQFSIFRMKDQ